MALICLPDVGLTSFVFIRLRLLHSQFHHTTHTRNVNFFLSLIWQGRGGIIKDVKEGTQVRKEWVVAQAGRTAQIMEETFHEVVRSNTVLLPGTKSKFTAEIRSNPFIYFLNLFCSLDLRPSPFYPFTLCVVPTPRRTEKHNRS
jgi:hypothetical protein